MANNAARAERVDWARTRKSDGGETAGEPCVAGVVEVKSSQVKSSYRPLPSPSSLRAWGGEAP